MGEDITSPNLSRMDLGKFKKCLSEETKLLGQWIKKGEIQFDQPSFGFELEGWLVNRDFNPSPVSKEFLEALKLGNVVHELSKFNFEINGIPRILSSRIFKDFENQLKTEWTECTAAANKLGAEPLMIGILPTVQDDMLSLDNMAPLNRYYALTERVLQLRKGHPLHIEIEGSDRLEVKRYDLMVEAAATSFQIHIKIKPEEAVRFFNSSMIVSGPMVALAANSPYLYKQSLWDETRIPVFEQAVTVEGFKEARGKQMGQSVTFGLGYLKESLSELFEKNLKEFPVLLPLPRDSKVEELRHLKIQNGVIWRWNRPIIDLDTNGKHHLRLEHRVLPAGPTIVDMIANMAFFVGVLNGLSHQKKIPEKGLPFEQTKKNFYSCAKTGFKANIPWIDGKEWNVRQLIFDELLPLAKESLLGMGIDQKDVDFYLGDVIFNRVKTGRNGSLWQKSYIEKNGRDFQKMTKTYYQNQKKNIPIYQWSL